MEGGSSKKEQPTGIKRGGKTQKLTAVDIDKQSVKNGGIPGFEYQLKY
jgi:hypothetical protein